MEKQKKSNMLPQIFAAVSATISLMSAGFQTGWAVPSLPKLLSSDYPIPITSDQGSWIASLLAVGAMASSILATVFVDRYGRKVTLLLSAVPTFVGCIVIACAQSYVWFYVARIMIGLSIGGAYTIAPMYVAEIAEDRVRGGIGILCNTMVNLGTVIVCSIGPWLSVPMLASVGALFPILFVLTFSWASESPYYYSMKNEPLKTQKSLEWLRGTNDVNEDHRKVDATVELDKQKSTSNIMDLVRIDKNRKALFIVLGLFTAQALSGNGAVSNYSALILNEILSNTASSIWVIVYAVIQFAVSIVVMFLADKVGRRPLLLVSEIMCIICLLIQAIYFHLVANGVEARGYSWLAVLGIIMYFTTYAIGLGSIPMLMAGELFSCSVKALGMSTCTIYIAVSGIAANKFYQIIGDNYGIYVAFYTFAGCSIVATIFMYFFIPETKGRSLNQIQEDLDVTRSTTDV